MSETDNGLNMKEEILPEEDKAVCVARVSPCEFKTNMINVLPLQRCLKYVNCSKLLKKNYGEDGSCLCFSL